MKKIKRLFSKLPNYILWALLSFFIWGWIFGMVNDTSTFHKVSIYIDCAQCRDMDLTLKLEEDMPEGIKMVKLHPLSYVVFDESTMFMGDILVLRESSMENYLSALTPVIGREALGWQDIPSWESEGQVYGLKVYDKDTGEGILKDYVTFLKPWEEPENFYLVFLKDSRHLGGMNGSGDPAAIEYANRLMTME